MEQDETFDELQDLNDYYEHQIFVTEQAIERLTEQLNHYGGNTKQVIYQELSILNHELRRLEAQLFYVRQRMDDIHRMYYGKDDR